MVRASRAGDDELSGIITPHVFPDALLGSVVIAATDRDFRQDFRRVAIIQQVDIMFSNVIEQERIRDIET